MNTAGLTPTLVPWLLDIRRCVLYGAKAASCYRTSRGTTPALAEDSGCCTGSARAALQSEQASPCAAAALTRTGCGLPAGKATVSNRVRKNHAQHCHYISFWRVGTHSCNMCSSARRQADKRAVAPPDQKLTICRGQPGRDLHACMVQLGRPARSCTRHMPSTSLHRLTISEDE